VRNNYRNYMRLQHRFPFLPPDATVVSRHIAVSRHDAHLTFYNASGPIYRCQEDDQSALRIAAAVLTDPDLDLAKAHEVAEVLGCHRTRVFEYRRRFRDGGVEAVGVQRRGPRGPHKLKGEALLEVQKLLDGGASNRRVAEVRGVTEGTIRAAIKQGRLVANKHAKRRSRSEGGSSTPRERNDVDIGCEGGVAVKRTPERAMARLGKLGEAAPEFTAAESVACGGVLVALPALLEQGLVEVGEAVYSGLRNGFFGLRSILLTFAFMALLRIKSIEGLSGHAPGEFGVILGLDRAPEMRTARRKLQELAERALAGEFSQRFTRRWAEDRPEVLGYLYVDGHVRPYHGRRHRLPKTHVQRRRLCMPATTDYWVNDAEAQPLLFVTAPANEGLLAMLDGEVLPRARELIGAERRFTVIFDREGWSPARFKKWRERGIDVLTYRKGKYEDWPPQCFSEVRTKIAGNEVTYLLGERSVLVSNTLWMREVRRLCPDGHQTSVMTTRQDIAMLEVARRMFSRWKQENFFRYMRHEFALDHLPTHAVEAADPGRLVPNPAIKEKESELQRLRSEFARLEREYGKRALENPERQRSTMRGFKVANAQLTQKMRLLTTRIIQLETEARALPRRVRIDEILDEKQVVRLERERKVFLDTIKMVAYRAETQLANLVGPLLPYREDEARSFIRKVFELPADVVPDRDRNRLVIRLHSMANPRSNRAVAQLCSVLNELCTRFPATRYTLRFEPPVSQE